MLIKCFFLLRLQFTKCYGKFLFFFRIILLKMQYKEVLTAFIITKNSEKTIERTLRSIVPLGSRIVILDTGSTDKTVQCCLQYGCTVWYDTWKNDFSYSRNLAISYCSTPWLLMIDSDEELSIFDSTLFEQECQNPSIGGFSVRIKNYLNEVQTSFSHHTYTRVFRNDKNIRFEGKIHEQILPSLQRKGLQILDSETEITHYGYIENSAEKRERNSILLQKEFTETGDDYIAYQLLLTYFADKRIDEVLTLGASLIHSEHLTLKQKELLRIRLAQSYLFNSNFQKMKEVIESPFTDIEYEFFRKYLLVVHSLQVRNFSKAKIDLSYLLSNFQAGMVTIEELQELKKIVNLI